MYFIPIQLLASTRCASRASISLLKSANIGFAAGSRISSQTRFASKSSPPSNPKPNPPSRKLVPPPSKAGTKGTPPSNPSKIKVTSAAKATSTAEAIPTGAKVESKRLPDKDRPREFTELDQSINGTRIVYERAKLVWPGIWSIATVVATYGVFAYMYINYGDAISSAALQPSRAENSDSWLLTPTVIRDGIKIAWQDLDKLTIGIIGFSTVIHALRRSGLFSQANFVHIVGRYRYTIFTHPFIYKNWVHLGGTSLILAWFLPGVVRHFDGDVYHTAAFLASVPVVISYLHRFIFRFIPMPYFPVNRGAMYICVAAFGAYSVAYAHEKIWTPAGVVVRLPSKVWASIGIVSFLLFLMIARRADRGVRALILVSGLGHFGLGAAYVHFDGKNKVWKPLVEGSQYRHLLVGR
ncbi:hypothetical protein L13192_02312 [Pyrenophora tritici-repentis]|uniref:Uncharacterized protein n=1 Tax=Pyrenophora tritici-repentis TaxID=45151 RepID=A0A922NS74_9PLEO|nr:hypothetical protein Ptr86124_000419 [Pyrenophora tritici-repentis]KAI1675565.1 hypothetical protein L13192_02312 [Pyrenophora tritici-repentis]KAI1687268.1 hypothetical protein KJE20_00445 [Pyrenophora tritici-repentis]